MEMLESFHSVVHTTKKLLFDQKEIDPEAEAIILYPSFGAPLLVQPGKTLQFYVLFERELFFLYRDELASDPQLTNTKKVINKSLKIFKWADGNSRPPAKLFPGDAAAKANIRCTYLRLLTDRSLEDKDGKLFAYLRKKTIDRYTSLEYGFKYLFLIEIDNLALTKSTGVFDCAWKLIDRKNPSNSMDPPLPIPDRQSLVAQGFLREGRNNRHFVKNGYGYKIEEKFRFKEDPNLPVNNHHVIYVTNKPKLNLGQLTDIHVSSRQMTFRVCEAQVLPGADTEASPKISTLANVSFETFKDLLDKMGNNPNVDLLVLTGDLIDFNQNFDPTAAGDRWRQDFKRPATLWQWMDPKRFEEEGTGRPPYPVYIDMLTIYSLLYDFVKTHKKPIVMLTGNHEAYEKPYGVSPRLGQVSALKPEGFMRPNEGIPADHNLTTYEATLLYGPGYGDIARKFNFDAKYLEWFYMMFNPLSDFTVTYGGAQSFTALSWNDSEQFLTNFGGGTLPRASEAVSDEQLKLLQAAKARGRDRVLLTHFTVVSYGFKYQITEPGEVNYNDLDEPIVSKITLMSNYEEGTFIKNRKVVYNMLYDGAFTHVFSGHSHRAGYYVMTEKDGFFSSNVKVQGYPIEEQAINPTAKLKGGKVRLIVGASAGPIPGQNYYGNPKDKGLANWTLERPAGNVMDFRADSLKLLPSALDTAQPRFAVALSFFHDLNEPVFEVFESGKGGKIEASEAKKDNEFKIVVHKDLPGERFIQGMTIYSYLNSWDSYGMVVSKDTDSQGGGQKLQAGTGSSNPDQFKRAVLDKRESNSSNTRFFLSTTFTDKELGGKIGYKQYNYKSPWIIPIKLVDKKQEAELKARVAVAMTASEPYGFNAYAATQNERMVENMVSRVSGYRIELSKKVPDFVWYQKNFNEYATDKPTSPPKDKEPGYSR